MVTLPHIEINVALDNGYCVRELYRVWEFKEFDATLFADYVRDFMRLKIQATGFPENVTTVEQKRAYLCEIHRNEGIWVEPTDVNPNPGLL